MQILKYEVFVTTFNDLIAIFLSAIKFFGKLCRKKGLYIIILWYKTKRDSNIVIINLYLLQNYKKKDVLTFLNEIILQKTKIIILYLLIIKLILFPEIIDAENNNRFLYASIWARKKNKMRLMSNVKNN